uniref:Uncharacterized protein n=1 Tax=Aegilops tauschii TaxID=37682 RepID=M8CCA5_AEGTA
MARKMWFKAHAMSIPARSLAVTLRHVIRGASTTVLMMATAIKVHVCAWIAGGA